ncbi:alpha/beta hydrolase [bacterium]|nr:alpha/beta hydrolase [bacterium]
MRWLKFCIFFFLSMATDIQYGFAQFRPEIDSTVNNLVHTPGYKTGHLGDLGAVKKYGNGQQNLILIPGLGFDASVFDDFMETNENLYTMYAITIAGYGKTAAPPMPAEGTSYGEQTWTQGTVAGLLKLIDKEKLEKPVIVGHFVQGTQIALRLAEDYPNKIGGVIILGGPAKFIVAMNGRVKDFPLDTMILFTDKATGPKWFKHMTRKFYDENNIRPEIYSLDNHRGMELWQQSTSIPLPVLVRYVCEYFASDVKVRFPEIQCPVLILRPTFSESILSDPVNNYVRPQYIDSWNDAPSKNSLIQFKDIQNASTFVWKDKPDTVYDAIHVFIKFLKNK